MINLKNTSNKTVLAITNTHLPSMLLHKWMKLNLKQKCSKIRVHKRVEQNRVLYFSSPCIRLIDQVTRAERLWLVEHHASGRIGCFSCILWTVQTKKNNSYMQCNVKIIIYFSLQIPQEKKYKLQLFDQKQKLFCVISNLQRCFPQKKCHLTVG